MDNVDNLVYKSVLPQNVVCINVDKFFRTKVLIGDFGEKTGEKLCILSKGPVEKSMDCKNT